MKLNIMEIKQLEFLITIFLILAFDIVIYLPIYFTYRWYDPNRKDYSYNPKYLQVSFRKKTLISVAAIHLILHFIGILFSIELLMFSTIIIALWSVDICKTYLAISD